MHLPILGEDVPDRGREALAVGHLPPLPMLPRRSATDAQEGPFGVGRRQCGRPLVGRHGLAVPAQPPEQIGSRGVDSRPEASCR